MTIDPQMNLNRMQQARELFAVPPKTEGLTQYLTAVHQFFALLAQPKEINVRIPKNPNDPVKLIPYLEWEFAIGSPKSYGFEFDHYRGHGIVCETEVQEAKMKRMCAAIHKVKLTFDAMKRPSSIKEAGFPIQILAKVSSTTLYAVLPWTPKEETNQFAIRMNEARKNFTTFTDFSKIGEYVLRVEDFYKLITSGEDRYAFLPCDQVYSLEIYLRLTHAEYNDLFPTSLPNTAKAISEVNEAFLKAFTI